MAKCVNPYCGAELDEFPEYEEHVEGYDEDLGKIIDIYEMYPCSECDYKNPVHVGSRPG